MNIIEAIHDEALGFRQFLADRENRLWSWTNWLAALRALYGLPIDKSHHDIIEQCTGRDATKLPAEGFDTALFLTGRRSGKSRIAAVCGAYEAVVAGHEAKLSRGERGVVAICAPTKSQGRIVKDYIRAIFQAPMLRAEVKGETKEGFELNNGTRIEIVAGDFRTIRGYTLVAAIVDEIAFFGLDDESKVKSDTELVRAIKPSLATVRGKLICISSPYARKGWCWKQYERNFGNDHGRVLVLNAPSRTLNPTLAESIVEDAMAEDLQAAKSEYLGEFRDDVAALVSREMVESLVVKNRLSLMPRDGIRYFAFCDVSGGRGDDAALAIAHHEGRKVVLDYVRRWRPPFNPYEVCSDMLVDLRRYHCRFVTGDNYAAEFVRRAFEVSGFRYAKSEKPKAALYLELLPRLSSREVELLDNDVLIGQLASLERRTRAGGRDIVDHPPGGHDDVANVLAGVCEVASSVRRIGAIPPGYHVTRH